MRVILTEDVQGTGKRGQVMEVRDGFGRNFLLPRGFAVNASEANMKRFEHIVKSMQNKKERDIRTAEEIKDKIEEATVIVRKKVGIDGKLFGSVTPKDIAEGIDASLNIGIDKKHILVGEPIKMTGAYTVTIHLDEGVHATLKVEVEKEE